MKRVLGGESAASWHEGIIHDNNSSWICPRQQTLGVFSHSKDFGVRSRFRDRLQGLEQASQQLCRYFYADMLTRVTVTCWLAPGQALEQVPLFLVVAALSCFQTCGHGGHTMVQVLCRHIAVLCTIAWPRCNSW